MKEITLAYFNGSYPTDLTFTNINNTATAYLGINPIDFPRPIKAMTSLSGMTLRNRKYKHRKAIHINYKFTISADELTESVISFINEFFKSDYKYLSINETDYFEVIFEDDNLEFIGIENIVELPEITINLSKVEAE